MPGTDEHLRKLMEREEAARRERIAHAVERGGMPDEAALNEMVRLLDEAFAQAEHLTMNVAGVSESDDGHDLPFSLTFEQIGLVSVLAEEIENRADDLQGFATKLRSRIWHLETLRREQERRVNA